MTFYAILETDAGLMVAEIPTGTTPEVVAEKHGGVVVDPGPYRDYEDACDAMLALQEEEAEEDVPQ
jgi:hypothetical protein